MTKKIAVIENGLIATYTIRAALMEQLRAKGFEVYVVTAPDGMKEKVEASGIHVVDVGSSRQNPLEIFGYISRLRKALKKIRPDVCLTYTIRPAIWGNIVTWSLGIPTITNITGIGPLFASNSIPYRAARFLYRFVLKNPKKIFFQNFDDLNLFLEKGFAEKERTERIPGSGVDYNHYAPREVERKGTFSFIYISRLIKDKGIVEYVQAAKALKEKGLPVECRVLGPLWTQNVKSLSVSEEELKQWIDKGWINYLGETSDVRDFIANADCVVLPSYREGTSNVLLESSSMAKPCITTDTTGCRDIVKDGVTGYLCRVQDGADLAEKMEKMFNLTEQERKAMGMAGREKVIREYDKKIVVDAYLRAIDEIISPANHRAASEKISGKNIPA
jgi:glycosyltransferase involved in cell wall biosynthesis